MPLSHEDILQGLIERLQHIPEPDIQGAVAWAQEAMATGRDPTLEGDDDEQDGSD